MQHIIAFTIGLLLGIMLADYKACTQRETSNVFYEPMEQQWYRQTDGAWVPIRKAVV